VASHHAGLLGHQEEKMILEKTALTFEQLQAETALELPRRDMLLITVVITNLLNNLDIDVDVTITKSQFRCARSYHH
jgi:hypothetical protein